jgi:hypothetical protein
MSTLRSSLYFNNAINLFLNRPISKPMIQLEMGETLATIDIEGQLFIQDEERVEQWTHGFTPKKATGIIIKEDE